MSGLVGLTVLTLAGLFGTASVAADATSHIRLHLALISCLLAAVASFHNRRLAILGALLAATNVGTSLSYARAPMVNPAGGPALKIMTINVLYRASNDAQILAQVANEQPDVILLQELKRERAGLLDGLKPAYPWQVSCAGRWACDVAVVSRRPWQAAGAGAIGEAGAKMAWARFGADGSNALIASIHLKWPFISDQAAQLQAVRDEIAKHRGPIIVAGDLNATAWSSAVRSFTETARLRSAGGLIPTWPQRTFISGRPCLVCVPQLQIDHVLVNSEVRVLSIRSGTDVGSDHLPLIAELELPRRIAASR